MCIIIHKPADKTLTEAIYRECWRVNNDGVGIAYVDPEKRELVVNKGYMNFKDAHEAIKAHEHLELLIHFRRISRGPVNKDNCHPFLVEAEFDPETKKPRYTFAIAHNGTFDIKPELPWSDTRTFVELVLKPWLNVDPDLFEDHFKVFVIKGYCTSKNKMVILRYDNEKHELKKYMINEDAYGCNQAMGCWFSNKSWEPTTQSTGYGYGNFPIRGSAFTNPTTSGVLGEYTPDHNGWRWDGEKKVFINIHTGVHTKDLSYRAPMDQLYVYNGFRYDRMKKPQLLGPVGAPDYVYGAVEVTQTTVPNLRLLSPGDSAEMNKPGDKPRGEIAVPRDAGVSPQQEEDDWERENQLSIELGACSMMHLDKKQKRELKRIAMNYCRMSLGKKALKNISVMEAVTYLRHEYREAYRGANALTLRDLDELILKDAGCSLVYADDPKEDREIRGYVS